MRSTLFGLIFSFGLAAPAVAFEGTAEDSAFFEKKIRPILEQHCLKCHSEQALGAGKLRGGLLLDSAGGWKKGGDTGPAIVPGKPADSLLIQSLSHTADLKMPPAGKLPVGAIADLTEWVRRGAQDPRIAKATAHKSTGPSLEVGRKFWSYQPVAKPAAPPVRDTAWPNGDIDRFILARLEAEGMRPAQPADRLMLFRRLSFDLTGLPPDPAAAQAFARSNDPQALEKAVDSMLASRAFAERWARHWLDVARFGESVTLRGFIFPNAWRYRDFVIDALATDMPYDRFIRLQIAGDLMPASSPGEKARNQIATTYLVLGNTNFEEQVKKQLDMDVVDDMLDTIGTGILGQTLGCARCHDHKFDPIPTRDYYALAGIFANVQAMEHSNVSKWIDLPLPVDAKTEEVLAERETSINDLEKRIKAAQGKKGAAKGVLALSQAPGIVVDDDEARKVGDWQQSTHSGTYLGKGYSHDKNEGKGAKTITFQPRELPAGRYAVWLAYSHGDSRSDSAPVSILCAEGEVEKKVSMKPAPPVDGRYVSLGEFQFETNVGHVIVSNEGTTGHVTADAVVFVPTDKKAPTSSTGEDQLAALRRELNELKARGPERPRSMGVREREKISDARVHIRGQVGSLGAVVPRGALQVISVPTPGIPAGQSGRLQLAEWITHPDHPLTARVMANRVWHWLFGAGLVRSVDNFGTTGEKPSHPELLDHLAGKLVRNGWSIKRLVREIVLSRTYGQASGGLTPNDPDNRLLAHAIRRRLDAECIRDAILSAGSNLDAGGYGGPGFGKAESDYSFTTEAKVRSIYLPVLRNVADPCLDVFDRADPSRVVGARDTSTVAPQALFLLNNQLVTAQARLAVGRVLADTALADDAARLERLWLIILGRPPTPAEARQTRERWPSGNDPEAAWSALAHALFASPDFRTLD